MGICYIKNQEEADRMHDKLTQKDIDRMKAEMEHRILVVRKEALEAVKEARAQGDLSENFEYKAAKQYKNQNESRIRYLDRMIKTAQVIDDKSGADEVGLDKKVTVRFDDDGELATYVIVTTVRGNSLKGYITVESPVGRALMGHKPGDRVYVKVNENTGYYLTVVSIDAVVDEDSMEIRKY